MKANPSSAALVSPACDSSFGVSSSCSVVGSGMALSPRATETRQSESFAGSRLVSSGEGSVPAAAADVLDFSPLERDTEPVESTPRSRRGRVVEQDPGCDRAEKVKIGNLVQLTVRVKPATKARKGRNPATGEEITIGPKPASVGVRARVLAKPKSALPSVQKAKRRLAA